MIVVNEAYQGEDSRPRSSEEEDEDLNTIEDFADYGNGKPSSIMATDSGKHSPIIIFAPTWGIYFCLYIVFLQKLHGIYFFPDLKTTFIKNDGHLLYIFFFFFFFLYILWHTGRNKGNN